MVTQTAMVRCPQCGNAALWTGASVLCQWCDGQTLEPHGVNVACPHCQGVLLDDGSMGGMLVACPQCGGSFVMAGKSATAQTIQGDYASRRPGNEAAKRTARRSKIAKNPLKTLMVIATVCWLAAIVLLGSLSYVLAWSGLKPFGAGHYFDPDTGLVYSSGQIGAAAIFSASVYGVAFPTAVYGVAIVALFVFWFATKKE